MTPRAAAASTAPRTPTTPRRTHPGFVPLSSGSSYLEAFYSSVYDQIDGTQFPNTCDCTIFQDNGAGLSWGLSVPAGGSVTRSLYSAFSPTGEPPPTEDCNNGIDDDGDGLVDGEDPDCPQDDPPTYGEDVDSAPVSGTVRYRPPGSDDFQTLTAGIQVPVGTIFDTREGRVRLTSARGPGGGQTQTADFYSGLFQVLQPDEEPPVTELKLLGFKQSDCTAGSDEVSVLRRRRRGLFGSGRGRSAPAVATVRRASGEPLGSPRTAATAPTSRCAKAQSRSRTSPATERSLFALARITWRRRSQPSRREMISTAASSTGGPRPAGATTGSDKQPRLPATSPR